MDVRDERGRWKRWGGAAALVGAGLVAGAVVAATATANADTGTSNGGYSAGNGGYSAGNGVNPPAGGDRDGPHGNRDESKSQRPDEHLLTGTTAEKVRAAALAKYPGATIQRLETDSDGVYEAHLTTKDGTRVTVEVGKDFAVTGDESAPR